MIAGLQTQSASTSVVVETSRDPQVATPDTSAFAASMASAVAGGGLPSALPSGGANPALSPPAATPGIGSQLAGTLLGMLPGGSLVRNLTGATDPTMAATQQMLAQSQQFNLQFLGLQETMQRENRSFSTLSNVLKARHETMRSTISNIK